MPEQLMDSDKHDLPSVGSVLVSARERAGLSQNDLAKKLYLSQTFIEHLESDQFDQLHQRPVFVRGYIRNYARLVNIPATQIEALLQQVHLAQPEAKHPKYLATGAQITARDKKVRLITYAMTVLLIVLIFIWWESHLTAHHENLTVLPATNQTTSILVTPGNANSTATEQTTVLTPEHEQNNSDKHNEKLTGATDSTSVNQEDSDGKQ